MPIVEVRQETEAVTAKHGTGVDDAVFAYDSPLPQHGMRLDARPGADPDSRADVDMGLENDIIPNIAPLVQEA